MRYFIRSDGTYVEYSKDIATPDGWTAVERKPTSEHVWNGSAWDHVPPSQEDQTAQIRASMVVSRFQARAALLNAGLLDAVETAVSNADGITKLAWSDAQEFRRNSPTIAALAGVVGLTDDQLDALFTAAAQIQA